MKKIIFLIITLWFIVSCTIEPGKQDSNNGQSNPEKEVITKANFTPAVDYANSHWRWTRYNHNSSFHYISNNITYTGKDVPESPMGLYFQPDFMCAEFVSRALTTLSDPNIFYDLNAASSSFDQYKTYVRSGLTYRLIHVGSHGTRGLYDFLINEGYGKEIVTNWSLARPGDVVFYYDGAPDYRGSSSTNREHTALLVSVSGANSKVTGHNVACYNFAYDNFLGSNGVKRTPSIVHLRTWVEFYPSASLSGVAGSATGSYSTSGNSAIINCNDGSCTLTFTMTGGTRYLVTFDYYFTGNSGGSYGSGSFTSPAGSVSIINTSSTHAQFEWKSANCSLYGTGSGTSAVNLKNLHFYRMQ